MAKISLIQNVKQSQKMALTPQLLKAIKLLELNNIDLDNYLEQEVLENPLLEKVSGNDNPEEIIKSEINNDSPEENIENSLSHDADFQGSPSFDTVNLYDSSSTSIDNIIEETLQSENSLYQSIIEQINISFINKIDRLIALSILEFIEPNGYLKVSTKVHCAFHLFSSSLFLSVFLLSFLSVPLSLVSNVTNKFDWFFK